MLSAIQARGEKVIRSSVAALKQQFENLFPGKWVNAGDKQKTLLTGIAVIDQSLTKGIARQRITEWGGSLSSGKTSILRRIISNWCALGFDVAYIDAEDRLLAADWISVEQETSAKSLGKFWVIRNLELKSSDAAGAHSDVAQMERKSVAQIDRKRKDQSFRQNHLWAADELVRTNAFDVVILDLGTDKFKNTIHSRVFARFQNSLAKSKTAMIIIRGNEASDFDSRMSGWSSHARLDFHWGGEVQSMDGLRGKVMIVPTIKCTVVKDGVSQSEEVSIISHVANRLFTHPQLPDRRTAKA